VIKRLNWRQLEQFGLDVSFAYRGDETDPQDVLVALSNMSGGDLDDVLDGVDEGAHAEGRKVVRRKIGGVDARVFDPPDGSRAIVGVTDCRALVVLGVEKRSAELLAPSVLKD
jgi:hypothetical protein